MPMGAKAMPVCSADRASPWVDPGNSTPPQLTERATEQAAMATAVAFAQVPPTADGAIASALVLNPPSCTNETL
jgi:hypothetical protein